jgi:hypothetical protein
MKRSIIPIFALSLACASCGKPENQDARQLYNQASEAFTSGDYQGATVLLDSLQRAYPGEIQIQREAMALRPQVIEQIAIKDIAVIDSVTALDKATMESLRASLKLVKEPGMIEGYLIDAKAYNANFMNSTGVEARVSEIGQFYIVSSANPQVGHTSITLKCNGGAAKTDDVAYDGDSNYRVGGGEIITFTPEQSDTIGAFAARMLNENGQTQFTLLFNGSKGSKMFKLTAVQAQGIANAYNYSRSVIRARDNEVQRARLEKTIEIAKRQASQTTTKVE